MEIEEKWIEQQKESHNIVESSLQSTKQSLLHNYQTNIEWMDTVRTEAQQVQSNMQRVEERLVQSETNLTITLEQLQKNTITRKRKTQVQTNLKKKGMKQASDRHEALSTSKQD